MSCISFIMFAIKALSPEDALAEAAPCALDEEGGGWLPPVLPPPKANAAAAAAAAASTGGGCDPRAACPRVPCAGPPMGEEGRLGSLDMTKGERREEAASVSTEGRLLWGGEESAYVLHSREGVASVQEARKSSTRQVAAERD